MYRWYAGVRVETDLWNTKGSFGQYSQPAILQATLSLECSTTAGGTGVGFEAARKSRLEFATQRTLARCAQSVRENAATRQLAEVALSVKHHRYMYCSVWRWFRLFTE